MFTLSLAKWANPLANAFKRKWINLDWRSRNDYLRDAYLIVDPKGNFVEEHSSELTSEQPTSGAAHAQSAPSSVEAVPLTTRPNQPDQLEPQHMPASSSLPYGFHQLDPQWITVERIAGWIFLSILAAGAAIALLIFAIANWPPGLLVAVLTPAALVLLSLMAWANHALPPISYRHAGWRLDEKGLEIRRGIFWRHEITIPLARVQHTDVHQGPLMRQYGLAKLIIHTAGTENASIEMEGLSFEAAHRLRDALVRQCEARHVQ